MSKDTDNEARGIVYPPDVVTAAVAALAALDRCGFLSIQDAAIRERLRMAIAAAKPAGVMLVTAARTIRKALKLSRFGMNHAKANLIDHGDLFENALKSIDDAFATLRKPPICEECNQPMETHWTCPTVARKIEAQSCCDRATNASEPAGKIDPRAALSVDAWTCACGVVNYRTLSHCTACSQARTAERSEYGDA